MAPRTRPRCAAAGFHRHNARLHFADKSHYTIATKATAQNHSAGLVEPDQAADVLPKINSEHEYRHRSVPFSFQTEQS
jgi:hypothetical protein